jgi:hypothetical protein
MCEKTPANYSLLILAISVLLTGCMAPRNISNSAKVTPKGNFVIGYNISGNIPTQTISSLKDVVVENVKKLARQDTIFTDENFLMMNRAAIAYGLDPFGTGTDIGVRYGIIEHLDAGIKIAGNAKAFDIQYQFLGPVGNIDNETDEKFYGSIGLQYSWQKQELPSLLADIQDKLGYSFKRKDILIPVLFGKSFGTEEKYGSLNFGFVLNYSKSNYSALPFNVFSPDSIRIMGVAMDQGFWSYSLFINAKAGYKFVYVVPALAVYRQNYGRYPLLDGNMSKFKGWTFIPSVGLKVRIGKNSVNPRR